MENSEPIKRTAVKSSNVKSVGFCPDRKCIDVEYGKEGKPGTVYRYEDCSQADFDAILAADKDEKTSVGQHVIANIKPKKYKKL